jgi:capsular polysaccharide biosynthesis protein
MNNTVQVPMQSADIFGILTRYRRLIITGTLLTAAAFLAAAIVMPKRYKSSFTLTIYSSYFQNPLIRDFTSEIFDGSEMKAQRESLIRQAISPEFVDSLGVKYGIYARQTPGLLQRFLGFMGKKYGVYLTTRQLKVRSDERKALLERIEVIGVGPSTFQIAFNYPNADIAYKAVNDIYAQVTRSLLDVRRNNLGAIHSAMEKRLESLSVRLPSLDKVPGAAAAPAATVDRSATPPMVDEELAEVRSQLRVLTSRYTDEHPLVKELRAREQSLMALGGNTVASTGGNREKPLAIRIPQDAAEDIYRELTKKLNYLNVAMDSDQAHASDFIGTLETPLYPTSPLWPRKSLFLLWGLGAGLLGSLMLAALLEYFDRAALRPTLLSQELNVPVVGEMPLIRWGAAFPNALLNGVVTNRPAVRN